jgi:glycosyltransferase involved in cell wall biosynthesis
LYLHTEAFGAYGGINLAQLLESLRIDPKHVRFVDQVAYKFGIDRQTLAAAYSACDVGLTPSLGEGFGLATIEFQACGVPVITSNFAASAELAGPQSWLVEGQPLWDATQDAWFNTPSIPSIVDALRLAYQQRGQDTQPTIDWVQMFANKVGVEIAPKEKAEESWKKIAMKIGFDANNELPTAIAKNSKTSAVYSVKVTSK